MEKDTGSTPHSAIPRLSISSAPSMAARLRTIGSRIAVGNSFKSADPLRGTQHILTAEGRQKLVSHYAATFQSAPAAVCTSLDTSPAFLDSCGFFSDYSRQNDLSFYEVGKAQDFVLQGRGYPYNIPRDGVSPGEKKIFSTAPRSTEPGANLSLSTMKATIV